MLCSFNNVFPDATKSGTVRFLTSRTRVKEAKGTQDFLGIDYYTRDYVSFDLLKWSELFSRRHFRQGAVLSTTRFLANEPLGIYEALKWGLKYNIPIIVTENGFDDLDDQVRPRYIAEHIHQMWRAVNFNWPIKGYFHST